ncbi:hypothetical protein FRAAL1519 [Frankia alni ACN14a]|uniref:Uncharacterized protein n=1 Tax=Frankia alni (strain DSM 45986 / CECT 9034 / ACN14a) TaxID=326424 RepID=Q0RQJ9_FRAAA|nr:hypothetical protein FRAAL1519 [Frankia alni ACN14a]
MSRDVAVTPLCRRDARKTPPRSIPATGGRGVCRIGEDDEECRSLMKEFIEAEPTLWSEDIGD